jgi:hypothetical protein
MATFVFDLNDSELRIARIGADSAEVVAQSTGFAMIDGRSIRFGDAAMQQFRLHPRQINNQFWNRLNTDPLAVRAPDTANHADLVYRHFSELVREAAIGDGDELVIATPGTTSNEQLGLLLGIATEARVTVSGLVDNAVVASISHPSPKRALHLDVFLHRSVVTEMTKTADGLARQRIEEVSELGFANLSDAWVNVIADRFVRDARFDPLSIAATDQQLYNQLHAWLADPARLREFGIDVDHRGSLRRVELNVEALIDKVAPRYRMLDRLADTATVFLSHRAARLPGLPEHLAGVAARVVVLDRMDSFRGVAQHQSLIRSDPNALRLVTRLPAQAIIGVDRDAPPAVPPTALRLPPERPTHVLLGSDAVAIGQSLTLDREGFPELPQDFPRDAVQIVVGNSAVQLKLRDGVAAMLDGDSAQSGTAISKGAVLDVAGIRFQLIRTRSGP